MNNPGLNIGHLSNADLLTRFGKLVQTERKITHLVLECIAEIDTRKLYLDKAYSSLYEFLVQEFGYSSSAALRRIESARLLREVPEVAAKIESGALNLSQLSKMQQAVRAVQKIEDRKLDVEEKKELLNRIEHTTQQQTEVILCQALSLPVLVENKERIHRDESVTLTITLSKEQMAILKQAQDLIAHAVPEHSWADAITYLANKEIQRRTKMKESKALTPVAVAATQNDSASNRTQKSEVKVRFLAESGRKPLRASVKKTVLKQDKCCQFKDRETGKICGSTRFLQVDHRQAVWAGGTNDIQNLRILCAQHNQHKYRQECFID
ncbi:HNH endonuclease [Bdellovibrio sp. HCB290]|uniref:HNH endonuclease n=1 Tax=Bdellovibrio sp. HCB290 TaxID=3394356 RepID=UPI0039B45B91